MESTVFTATPVTEWSVAQLSALPLERLQSLTRRAVGTLAVSRLLIGRCILALEETDGAQALGFSGALHFVAAMGLELPEARKARRVARMLEGLPLLRDAAEAGNVPWASLTAIVSKATPETEADWLKLARIETYHQIRRRVARTEQGDQPGALDEEGNAESTELRLSVSPEILEAFRMASIEMSEEAGRRVPTIEVFERLVVGYHTGERSPSQRDVEAVLAEARKNLELDVSRPAPVTQGLACEETPAYVAPPADEIGWLAASAEATPCPGEPGLSLVERRNPRLRFRQSRRLATRAQRRDLLRRDGFRCSTPDCPHHLWLNVHHIVFYCDGGKTIPDNLIVVCSKCHRNIHEGNLVLRGTVGRIRWTDRKGVELLKNALPGRSLGLLRHDPTLTMPAWEFD